MIFFVLNDVVSRIARTIGFICAVKRFQALLFNLNNSIQTDLFICRKKIDNKVIQVEGEIYWEVDTLAFRVYWTIIRTMKGDISDIKPTMDV